MTVTLENRTSKYITGFSLKTTTVYEDSIRDSQTTTVEALEPLLVGRAIDHPYREFPPGATYTVDLAIRATRSVAVSTAYATVVMVALEDGTAMGDSSEIASLQNTRDGILKGYEEASNRLLGIESKGNTLAAADEYLTDLQTSSVTGTARVVAMHHLELIRNCIAGDRLDLAQEHAQEVDRVLKSMKSAPTLKAVQ